MKLFKSHGDDKSHNMSHDLVAPVILLPMTHLYHHSAVTIRPGCPRADGDSNSNIGKISGCGQDVNKAGQNLFAPRLQYHYAYELYKLFSAHLYLVGFFSFQNYYQGRR